MFFDSDWVCGVHDLFCKLWCHRKFLLRRSILKVYLCSIFFREGCYCYGRCARIIDNCCTHINICFIETYMVISKHFNFFYWSKILDLIYPFNGEDIFSGKSFYDFRFREMRWEQCLTSFNSYRPIYWMVFDPYSGSSIMMDLCNESLRSWNFRIIVYAEFSFADFWFPIF